MVTKRHCTLSFLLAALLLLTACGGGDASAPSTTGEEKATKAPVTLPTATTAIVAVQDEPATTEAAEPEAAGMTPEELGAAIGDIYLEAMTELTGLIADKPAFDEVKPQVEELKETIIQKLVELGREREALSDQEKATVDSAIRMALNRAYNDPAWTTYSKVLQHYASEDFDFHQLLSSFNIITQYANFDLLKQQEPVEAARLGIG